MIVCYFAILSLCRSLQFGARLAYDGEVKLGGLTSNVETLQEIQNLIITGCGTSLNAALYAQRLMQYLKSFETIQVVDSAEVISDTFPIGMTREKTGVLAISQSGTALLYRLSTAKRMMVYVFF